MTGSSSLFEMNLIIFSDGLFDVTGVLLFSFLKDEIGRDWYFFSSNCFPDSFYIKCWVFFIYSCIFVLKTLAVWGLLLSITVPIKLWLYIDYCLFIIDFDDCWRLKLLPVWDISLKVLLDSLSYTREPSLDIPLEVGRLPPNLSAEGTRVKPTIGLFNFSLFFYSLSLKSWTKFYAFSNLLFELDLLTDLLKTVDCSFIMTWCRLEVEFRPNATTKVFLSYMSWFLVYLLTDGSVPYENPKWGKIYLYRKDEPLAG